MKTVATVRAERVEKERRKAEIASEIAHHRANLATLKEQQSRLIIGNASPDEIGEVNESIETRERALTMLTSTLPTIENDLSRLDEEEKQASLQAVGDSLRSAGLDYSGIYTDMDKIMRAAPSPSPSTPTLTFCLTCSRQQRIGWRKCSAAKMLSLITQGSGVWRGRLLAYRSQDRSTFRVGHRPCLGHLRVALSVSDYPEWISGRRLSYADSRQVGVECLVKAVLAHVRRQRRLAFEKREG